VVLTGFIANDYIQHAFMATDPEKDIVQAYLDQLGARSK
jgi:hypothetical protein